MFKVSTSYFLKKNISTSVQCCITVAPLSKHKWPPASVLTIKWVNSQQNPAVLFSCSCTWYVWTRQLSETVGHTKQSTLAERCDTDSTLQWLWWCCYFRKTALNFLNLKPWIALFLYTPSSGSFKTMSAEQDQDCKITSCMRAQILQKSRGHLKILGARWVTCSKFHTKTYKY